MHVPSLLIVAMLANNVEWFYWIKLRKRTATESSKAKLSIEKDGHKCVLGHRLSTMWLIMNPNFPLSSQRRCIYAMSQVYRLLQAYNAIQMYDNCTLCSVFESVNILFKYFTSPCLSFMCSGVSKQVQSTTGEWYVIVIVFPPITWKSMHKYRNTRFAIHVVTILFQTTSLTILIVLYFDDNTILEWTAWVNTIKAQPACVPKTTNSMIGICKE